MTLITPSSPQNTQQPSIPLTLLGFWSSVTKTYERIRIFALRAIYSVQAPKFGVSLSLFYFYFFIFLTSSQKRVLFLKKSAGRGWLELLRFSILTQEGQWRLGDLRFEFCTMSLQRHCAVTVVLTNYYHCWMCVKVTHMLMFQTQKEKLKNKTQNNNYLWTA